MENYIANFLFAVVAVQKIIINQESVGQPSVLPNKFFICKFKGVRQFGLAVRSRELVVTGLLFAACYSESDEDIELIAREAAGIGCPWWYRVWLWIRHQLSLQKNHDLAYDW